MEAGIIYIPNNPPQKRLPRKKKKAYIRCMGPKAYRNMLAGHKIITSDYPMINGVVFAPWNKKETRKFKWVREMYYKKPINPNLYGTIRIDEL